MIKAKKQFGQNFLKDTSVLDKIIKSMPHNNANALVEIGPGLGDLTQRLLEVKPLKAYEVDDELSELLKKNFEDAFQTGRLDLQETDVLGAWEEQGSLHVNSYDLVANLPYYIATTIILNALKDKKCKSITVMVQKEVAQKFSANSGDKEFSSLAILTQTLGTSRLLFDVAAHSFDPPPKVTSSVMQIVKEREFVSEDKNGVFESFAKYKQFENYLRQIFKSPRKTAIKNLSGFWDKTFLTTVFESLGLAPTLRPHQIDTATHHHLFNELTKVIEDDRKDSKQ